MFSQTPPDKHPPIIFLRALGLSPPRRYPPRAAGLGLRCQMEPCSRLPRSQLGILGRRRSRACRFPSGFPQPPPPRGAPHTWYSPVPPCRRRAAGRRREIPPPSRVEWISPNRARSMPGAVVLAGAGGGAGSARVGRTRRRHVWLGAVPFRRCSRLSLSRRFLWVLGGDGGCDMSDLGDWFRSIPLITRYWFAGSIAVPLIGKLGLVSPVYLFLWPDAFINRFQVRATLLVPACPAAPSPRLAWAERARHAGNCSAGCGWSSSQQESGRASLPWPVPGCGPVGQCGRQGDTAPLAPCVGGEAAELGVGITPWPHLRGFC